VEVESSGARHHHRRVTAGRIGEYDVSRELGRGAMGVVLDATHPRLGRVALKVLTAAGADLDRVRREVAAVRRLDHPAIVGVLDAGQDRGQSFIALRFVDGESLDARLRRGPLPEDEVVRIAVTLCGALEHAHSRGVLHRDLKPANVLLDRVTGEAVLADFGLARVTGAGRLTVTGEVLGTPCFMSPEQAQGDPRGVGTPSDVYGLGAIMYAMLTGRPPFEGASTLAVLERVLRDPVPRPSLARTGLTSPELERLVLACLAKDAKARPTLDEVALALEALGRRRPAKRARRRRSRAPLVAAVVMVVAIVAVTIAVTSSTTHTSTVTATAPPPPPPRTPTPTPTPPATEPLISREEGRRLATERGREAARRYEAGDAPGALALTEEAIALAPTWGDTWLSKAVLLASLGRHADALVALGEAERAPEPASVPRFELHMRRAASLLALERRAEAERAISDAYASCPTRWRSTWGRCGASWGITRARSSRSRAR
jgi:serine/threonine protein kinase